MPEAIVRYFLAYTNDEDWTLFQSEAQSTFGFTNRWRNRASSLADGDLLVCYMTAPHQAWCGILRKTSVARGEDTTSPEQIAKYPVRIGIERVVVLPTSRAIPVFNDETWQRISMFRDVEAKSAGWVAAAKMRNELTEIPSADGDVITRLVTERAALPPVWDEADSGFDPSAGRDERERARRSILARRGQRAFRDSLMSAYSGACAVTGCTVRDVLEAAHITPYRGARTNHVTNGLLLRADIHTLWDCGLIAVSPDTRTILLADGLRNTEYATLLGGTVARPNPAGSSPSAAALQDHIERVFLSGR